MKKLSIIIFSIFFTILIAAYLSLVYVVPNIINSPEFLNLTQTYLQKKYSASIEIDNINLKITPTLKLDLKIKSLNLTKADNKAVILSNLSTNADIKRLKLYNINADEIFINLDYLLKVFPKRDRKNTHKRPFDLNKLPNIHIKELSVIKHDNVEFLAKIKDLKLIDKDKNNKDINLKVNFKLDRLLKEIQTGETGKIYIQNNNLIANNYSIFIGNEKFYLNGNILEKGNLGEFELNGEDISAAETMKILVFLQRFTDNTKKFIENFKDFKGTLEVHAKHKNNEFTGYGVVHNIEAKTVLFNLPLKVKKAEFFMKDNQITSFAEGIAGKERITHKLLIKNVTSKDRKVFGEVKTTITERMVKNYLPKDIRLKNNIKLEIDYEIQHRKVDVKYYGDFSKGTVLFFKHYYSEMRDKEKRIYAHTYKDGINLYLKDYKYSIKENGVYKDILTGTGFFINDDGHMFPKYITCKTNGFVPNSVAGSFGQYVIGGKFNGNLRYNIPEKQILGEFEVIDTIFNHFKVKSAKVTGDEKLLKVKAKGTYKKELFTCEGDAKNDFHDKIYVNNMDLFLDKFVIKKHNNPQKSDKKDIDKTAMEIGLKVRKINMDIDRWQIKTNRVIVKDLRPYDIIVDNILLKGSLKNSVFKYGIPELKYANGILTALGNYDFNTDTSIIDFSASNINSNIIAEKLFNLPNQVKGTAKATLHSQTDKNLSNWKAYATFEIDKGSLPQLLNMEFNIKKNKMPKKIKVSDYVKVKAQNKGKIKSNLKGSFWCDENNLYDIDIRMQHEFMSLFVNGKYNFNTENENINVYGKYDNEIFKQIKIMHIPLNWIINTLISKENAGNKYQKELNKIPPIGIDNKDAKYFKLYFNGNPNKKPVDFTVKVLKTNNSQIN